MTLDDLKREGAVIPTSQHDKARSVFLQATLDAAKMEGSALPELRRGLHATKIALEQLVESGRFRIYRAIAEAIETKGAL
jgi:hypothetical protein